MSEKPAVHSQVNCDNFCTHPGCPCCCHIKIRLDNIGGSDDPLISTINSRAASFLTDNFKNPTHQDELVIRSAMMIGVGRTLAFGEI